MLLALALGITACLVAWGYLVYVAIDFGSTARRDGDTAAWGLLLLAGVGAVACLFLGFMLIARLARALTEPEPAPEERPEAPPVPGPPARRPDPPPLFQPARPTTPAPRAPRRPPPAKQPTKKSSPTPPRGKPKKQKKQKGGKRAAR